ncbi:MAG: hypothetical protein WCG98_09450 [bacterium]
MIKSIANIWTAVIAIGKPNTAPKNKLSKTANNSPPLDVIQDNIVFLRLAKIILPSLIA